MGEDGHTPGPMLYSVNPFLTLVIQAEFRGDLHYVWCSESFDASKLNAYTVGRLVPRSSNPAQIYRDLKADVEGGDLHSQVIERHRATLSRLAVEWFTDGSITEQQRDDILYMVNKFPITYWRPVLYVIPRAPLGGRCRPVPADRRAGIGPEYIVQDLRGDEFDPIEP